MQPTLVLQAMPFSKVAQARAKSLARKTHLKQAIYVGFTASKKVGNAVVRNRAKRRLVALTQNILPQYGQTSWAYVFIARSRTVQAPFESLKNDMMIALWHLQQPRGNHREK